jgi:dethiobiotin synthetase
MVMRGSPSHASPTTDARSFASIAALAGGIERWHRDGNCCDGDGAMTTGIFVIGTDTGTGKTVAACALLRAYADRGLRSVGMKPVASGIADSGRNEDVTALEAAGNVDAPAAARNPYAFAPAIAPHLAAAQAGVKIELARIDAAYRELALFADRIVVEGAGGAFSPLDDEHDMLDIALTIRLPVLLVVGVRLGCLNHALLSALAIRARGLLLAGWVANAIEPALPFFDQNVATIERRLAAPRLATLPWSASGEPRWGGAVPV